MYGKLVINYKPHRSISRNNEHIQMHQVHGISAVADDIKYLTIITHHTQSCLLLRVTYIISHLSMTIID